MENSIDKRILRLERVMVLLASRLEAPAAPAHWEELYTLLHAIRADVKVRTQ
jgi:hypothetical protein